MDKSSLQHGIRRTLSGNSCKQRGNETLTVLKTGWNKLGHNSQNIHDDGHVKNQRDRLPFNQPSHIRWWLIHKLDGQAPMKQLSNRPYMRYIR